MNLVIEQLTTAQLQSALDELTELLIDGVENGASISFISPLTAKSARDFWKNQVLPAVSRQERIIWVARRCNQLVGTVQLLIAMPPNQRHRGEVAKLLVHSQARGQGIGKALMEHLLSYANTCGKTLITLDTAGVEAWHLYRKLGFSIAGEIPNYAMNAANTQLQATTYMYKQLSQANRH